MNAMVAAVARASVGPASGKTRLYYARLKAARCLRSGWTMEQATGRYSEYGWVRSLDKSPARPLRMLAAREAEIGMGREFDRDMAA